MSKFALCRPDYKNGLVWCQFPNGSWAPPFPMSDKEKSPKDISLNDDSEENKPQQ